MLAETGGQVDLVNAEIDRYFQCESEREQVREAFYSSILYNLQLTRIGLYNITHPKTDSYDLPTLVGGNYGNKPGVTSTQHFELVLKHCSKEPFSHTAIAVQLLIDSAKEGRLKAKRKDLKEGAEKCRTWAQAMVGSVKNFFSFNRPKTVTVKEKQDIELKEIKITTSKPRFQ